MSLASVLSLESFNPNFPATHVYFARIGIRVLLRSCMIHDKRSIAKHTKRMLAKAQVCGPRISKQKLSKFTFSDAIAFAFSQFQS